MTETLSFFYVAIMLDSEPGAVQLGTGPKQLPDWISNTKIAKEAKVSMGTLCFLGDLRVQFLTLKSVGYSGPSPYLLDRIEKTILEGPLVNIPHPVWFPSHRNSVDVAHALIRLDHRPSVLRLPGLGAAVVKGMCLLLALLLSSAGTLRAEDKSSDQPAETTASVKSLKLPKRVPGDAATRSFRESPTSQS